MRAALYQFAVTGDVKENIACIKKAVKEAVSEKADLIVFPECALSGYPPRDISSSKDCDFNLVSNALEELKELADKNGINIIVGLIVNDGNIYNRACFISPNKAIEFYDKRALYGWDEENFTKGEKDGIFEIAGLKIGVRICFEVRFPEYFRELYLEKTDLNIVLFNDVSGTDDIDRYNLIKSHLITRAVENVTPVLSVNTITPFETAPTCYIDASGKVLFECNRNKEEMLVFDFEKKELNFGEIGRKRESDSLLGIKE